MSTNVEKPSTSGNSKEIWIHDFSDKCAQEFREQVQERSEQDPHSIIPIYIDSYGGNVDALAKMIATMDEVPNRFITVCMGKSISCGAILLSHGDLRFCDKYSRVMVHNVSTVSWGDVYSLKSTSEEAMRMNRVFMGLLAKNCGISYETLQQKIKDSIDSKEIWMSAADALKFNIIDQIGVPELTPIMQWACNTRPDKERLNLKEASEKTDEMPVPPKKRKGSTPKKKK